VPGAAGRQTGPASRDAGGWPSAWTRRSLAVPRERFPAVSTGHRRQLLEADRHGGFGPVTVHGAHDPAISSRASACGGISFYAGSACAGSGLKGSGRTRPPAVTPAGALARGRPEHAASRTSSPGRRLDLGALAAPFSVPAARDGRAARPSGAAAYSTRLTAGLHPDNGPASRWHQVILNRRAARSTLWPQIPLRLARQPGSRAGSRRVPALGPRPGRPRGRCPHGAAADYPPGADPESPGPGRGAYPSPAGQQTSLLYEQWATSQELSRRGDRDRPWSTWSGQLAISGNRACGRADPISGPALQGTPPARIDTPLAGYSMTRWMSPTACRSRAWRPIWTGSCRATGLADAPTI